MKQRIIKYLVKRSNSYLNKNRPMLIAVVGSIGKTSTTQAIATVLETKHTVRKTKGSYNGEIGVVMSIFGESIKTNLLGWMLLISRVTFKSLFSKPKEEIFILELSPETSNGMAGHSYLKPDLTVITAITPEHMEYYADLDAVAKEELSVSTFSKKLLINLDMVEGQYIHKYCANTEIITYAIKKPADFRCRTEANHGNLKFSLSSSNVHINNLNLQLVGAHSAYMVAAAAAVGITLGFNESQIKDALQLIRPVAGRMQLLNGLNGSLIIDDTYNSSPEAVKAALETLYSFEAPQRIALLGNMNELGSHSQTLHTEVGQFVKKEKIDLLVTLGPDSNNFLAAAAEANGVNVLRTDSPIQAGRLIASQLKQNSVVLVKGSQNKVFAEEAVKLMLRDKSDVSKLVRQTGYWIPLKQKQFPDIKK